MTQRELVRKFSAKNAGTAAVKTAEPTQRQQAEAYRREMYGITAIDAGVQAARMTQREIAEKYSFRTPRGER